MRGTAKDFGAFLERTVGRVGYLIGTRGQLCTRALIAQKKLEYPAYANRVDFAVKWLGLPVADCMGWCEMFENGGDAGQPVETFIYPDRRTWADYRTAQELGLPNGPISTVPKDRADQPIAVGYDGHVGYYYKGMVYQSAGHVSGTVVHPLEYVVPGLKPWTYWYYMPYLAYEEDVLMQKGDKDPAGVNGPVTAWQNSLLSLGIKMVNNGVEYGADGSFGQATVNGTNTFKAQQGLPQNGIVDEATFGKMLDALRQNWDTSRQSLASTEKSLEEAESRISGAVAILTQ
jgi:hypothetical protein